MKYLLALLALTITAIAAEPPVVTVDLYGNVFLNGENTNSQIGDFARNNPELAPQVDGAVRDAALAARTRIATDISAAQASANAQVAAKEAEKQAAITAAEAAIEAAQASHAVALAAKDEEVATLRARIAELEAAAAPAPEPEPSP